MNVAYSQLVFKPQVDKHGGRAQPEKRLPPMSMCFKLLQPREANKITNHVVVDSAWFDHPSNRVSSNTGFVSIADQLLIVVTEWFRIQDFSCWDGLQIRRYSGSLL